MSILLSLNFNISLYKLNVWENNWSYYKLELKRTNGINLDPLPVYNNISTTCMDFKFR